MRNQNTKTVLMIEPVSFGYNHETAVNNFFQQNDELLDSYIQSLAYTEFTEMVAKLRANGINVIVVSDTLEPHTPDSIFPNNWVSFHGEGQVVLYPMFAKNRRSERRNDILDYLINLGCNIENVDDFTYWENNDLFLEGTGSMVLDRVNRIAYAALSERTDQSVFLQFCKVFEFEPVSFCAFHSLNENRLAIFHTNILLTVADKYAVICSDSIDNELEREMVLEKLKSSGKEIIQITEKQLNAFAGNMIQLKNENNDLFVVMSQSAFDSLTKDQVEKLKKYNDLIVCDIPTIEKIGGGSVRCMMAEIF